MKTKLLFLLLSVFFVFTACDHEEATIAQQSQTSLFQENNPFRFSPENIDGHILIISNQLEGSEQPATFSISGNLKNKKGEPMSWSELSIEGIPLKQASSRDGEVYPGKISQYFHKSKPTEGYNDIYSAFQKANINFSLNNVEENIEIPNTIKMDLSANTTFYHDNMSMFDNLSIKKDLVIRWNPNSSTSKDLSKVAVYVVYHGAVSRHYVDENLPAENKTIFKLADDSAGEIVIRPSELAEKRFPENGLMTITIARAGAHLVNTLEDLEIAIGGVTYEASNYIQISYQ